MNSPSPLIPQGSNLEQQSKTRSSLRLKIFCALGVNVAVLLVLLMQGCKREQPAAEPEQIPVYSDTNPPPIIETVDTNLPVTTVVDTNPVPTAAVPPVEALMEAIVLISDSFVS